MVLSEGPLSTIFVTCFVVETRELLKDTIHCNIEEQVAMFLHVVGHNQRFTFISLSFRWSTKTISRHFQEVLYAVGELRNEITVPTSSAVPTRIQNIRR
jgi:predicted chitinase